jgi:hypothetical protein
MHEVDRKRMRVVFEPYAFGQPHKPAHSLFHAEIKYAGTSRSRSMTPREDLIVSASLSAPFSQLIDLQNLAQTGPPVEIGERSSSRKYRRNNRGDSSHYADDGQSGEEADSQ